MSISDVSDEDQQIHFRFKCLGHEMRTDSNYAECQLLCSKLKGKVGSRGGVPLRWTDLTRDPNSLDWREVAHNQPQWREAI